MPISLLKIHSPASLRSDGVHHHVGIDAHDEIESAFTIRSETALSFVGIRNQDLPAPIAVTDLLCQGLRDLDQQPQQVKSLT